MHNFKELFVNQGYHGKLEEGDISYFPTNTLTSYNESKSQDKFYHIPTFME